MKRFATIGALGALAISFFIISPVSAQTDATASVDADTSVSTTQDTAEALDGIHVDTVNTPPSAFGLFWRGLRERVSILATRDPVKKAEKQIKFAEERIRIAEKLGEKTDDPAVQERLDAMLTRAQELIANVEARKDEFINNPDERAQRVLRNVVVHQVRRDQALDRIEEKIPEEHLQQFEDRRAQLEEQGKQFLGALTNDRLPEAVREQLMNVRDRIEAKAQVEQEFRAKRLELREAYKNGDITARDQLEALREDRKETLEGIRDDFKAKAGEIRGKVEEKVQELRERAADGDAAAAAQVQRLDAAKERAQVRQESSTQVQRSAPTRPLPPSGEGRDEVRAEFRANGSAQVEPLSDDREARVRPQLPPPPKSPALRALRKVEEIRENAQEHVDEGEAEM